MNLKTYRNEIWEKINKHEIEFILYKCIDRRFRLFGSLFNWEKMRKTKLKKIINLTSF